MGGLDVYLVSVINGFAFGFLLFILAVGLSLVFGMMDVLNLAHGALFLAGAFIATALAGEPSWGGFIEALAVAALVGLVAGAVLSAMTEPLAHRSHLDQALLTLGIAFIVGELLVIWFGDDPLRVAPPPGLDGTTTVFGVTYPTYRLALIAIGAVLALAVHLVVERTRVGALVRATVADRDMVATLGIDNRLVKAAVFAVGALLATVGGVLAGPYLGNVAVGLDVVVLILALVVVVIGGLGSVKGALVGALVVGQIETLGRALLPELASFVLFGALALVLVLRPQGLFGARTGIAR